MASQLKRLGYKHVTLLEKTDRVGGKSFSVYLDADGRFCKQKRDRFGNVDTSSCVTHELGSVYLFNNFQLARQLNKQYGLKPTVPLGEDAVKSNFTVPPKYLTLQQYMVVVIQDLVSRGMVVPPSWLQSLGSNVIALYVLIDEARRFSKLHQALIGYAPLSLPRRPSPMTWSKLNGTLDNFFIQNNLPAFRELFVFLIPLNGYGYLSEVPAYYGLSPLTLESVNGLIQESLNKAISALLGQRSPALIRQLIRILTHCLVGGNADEVEDLRQVLPEGWGKLWTAMHEQDDLDVRLNAEILDDGIDRQLGNPQSPVKVTFRQLGQRQQSLMFDILMYSAPHALANRYVKDLTLKERLIFSDLRAGFLMPSLYQGDALPGYSTKNSSRTFSVDVNVLINEIDGDWFADIHPRAIHSSMPASNKAQERIGYQYYAERCAKCNQRFDWFPNRSSVTTVEEVGQGDKLLRAVEAAGGENGKIWANFPWPYFWRFSQQGLTAGLLWDLFDLQGRSKTYWIGASASFETIRDVMNYNLLILKQHFGAKLDSNGIVMPPAWHGRA